MAGVVLIGEVKGLMDSKKLTEKKREALYPLVIANSRYHIVSFSAKEVDELGISKCLHNGLLSIQENLEGCDYLFDGNSTFGVDNITTMVKADDKVQEVSAASILAKVTRDREIVEQSKLYPEYGFERHKGYGTKAHMEALVKYDRCPIHRKTFRVKGLDDPVLFS
jgi:ribonuclease HII